MLLDHRRQTQDMNEWSPDGWLPEKWLGASADSSLGTGPGQGIPRACRRPRGPVVWLCWEAVVISKDTGSENKRECGVDQSLFWGWSTSSVGRP